MALLDLLGRRWTLRILWELRVAPAGFRALQALCGGMSPSVLSQRLGELSEAGIVTQASSSEYLLTELGQDLIEALQPLNAWAGRWIPDPA
jgi:DNA-binding HxlR family transcriptional regulator